MWFGAGSLPLAFILPAGDRASESQWTVQKLAHGRLWTHENRAGDPLGLLHIRIEPQMRRQRQRWRCAWQGLNLTPVCRRSAAMATEENLKKSGRAAGTAGGWPGQGGRDRWGSGTRRLAGGGEGIRLRSQPKERRGSLGDEKDRHLTCAELYTCAFVTSRS